MHQRHAPCMDLAPHPKAPESPRRARHVVLGSGQIGAALARHLRDLGHEVVSVRRSTKGAPDGVQAVVGDVADPGFAARIGRDADVLYHVMNPAYHRWPAELPGLTDGALRAAEASGARLVVLDNLYAFGRTGGAPMREDGPQIPCSEKGALRKAMAERLLAAHAAGRARVTIARPSDFVGPEIVQAHLGARFFERILAGKTGECMGDPSLPHAFSYGPDVVAALAVLGADDRALGRAWHLPTGPARSMRDWAEAFGVALGRPVRVAGVPRWAVRLMGVFSPQMRELLEMRYQWEEPYLLDDGPFRATFGLEPTPFAEQVRATADWARRTFGR